MIRDVVAECRPGDRRWLSFLETRIGRHDVVMTDVDTCWYVPAFHGKVVAYPMNIPFVPDYEPRLAAVNRFFAPEASNVERREILQRYGIAPADGMQGSRVLR